jgi:hypothetical protein
MLSDAVLPDIDMDDPHPVCPAIDDAISCPLVSQSDMSSFSSILQNLPSQAIATSRGQTSPSNAALKFPTNETPAYGVLFKFVKYQYDISGTKAQFASNIQGSHIFLPMPTSINNQISVNYDMTQLGIAGVLYKAGYDSGKSVGDAMKGMDIGSANQVLSKAGNVAVDTSAYVARKFVSGISAETGASIDLSRGTVPNPYTVATFQNVTPRQHTLNFRLVPTSQKDSQAIQKIVKNFEYHSLPGKSDLFLTYPDELEIAFFGSEYLFQFARCVLLSVQTNYTPMGAWSPMVDTAPAAVEITLNLQEIEQLTREAYGTQGIVDASDPNTFNPDGGDADSDTDIPAIPDTGFTPNISF